MLWLFNLEPKMPVLIDSLLLLFYKAVFVEWTRALRRPLIGPRLTPALRTDLVLQITFTEQRQLNLLKCLAGV